MSVRGPGQPPVIRPGGGTGGGAAPAPAQPTALDALSKLGLFKGGMDSQAAMAKLLSFLVLQGFAPKLEGLKDGGQPMNDASQLADALKNLQGKEGIPQSGRLDDKTMKALERLKPPTTSGDRATERQPASADKQAASRMAASFKDQTLAAWIKNKTADLPQAKPPQNQLPVNQAPQAQQAQAKPTQLESQPQNQQQLQNDPQQTTKKEADSKAAAQQDGRATREAGDGKPPPTNVKMGEGAKGEGSGSGAMGGKEGKGTGKLDEKPGGNNVGEEGVIQGEADEMTAFEDGRGNQATGDEDEEDERRGAALVDDGSGVDEGAYEIPSVSQQVRDALATLEKELDVDPNRPTTYHVDFVLYKPGVYQSRTQASQLLNLKVVKATAYDDVWAKVIEQVNARLKAFEPEAPMLTDAQVHGALQVARVRGS